MSNLRRAYYSVNTPCGYTSVEPLKRHAATYTRQNIKKWLEGQDAYTLHRQIRKRFRRNRYAVNNIDDLFQADLIDLQSLAEHNDGYKYILMVIDVFSKHSWAQPLKTKTAAEVVSAFEHIFETSKRIPENMQTDKGKEFLAVRVQQFFKKHNVNFYVSQNPDVKACIVERINRTIKGRMFKYFTHQNTLRYIDILQDIITSYNNSYHRSIRMAPSQVCAENILEVWHNLQGSTIPHKKPKYAVDDYVRITRFKHVFDKGYTHSWSDEIFKVLQVIPRNPVVYKICDLAGEPIDGSFYTEEMQKIRFNPKAQYKIDRVIAEKGKGVNRRLLVKWQGYPDKFNSWVSADNIEQV